MYEIKDNPFFHFILKHKDEIYRIIRSNIPDREPVLHYDLISDYPERQGKYIRPGLVLLMAELLGNKAESAYRPAAAMQTSEDWILVHDDIMDGALTRRDKPALHVRKDASLELALNAADALHIIQWKILLDPGNSSVDIQQKLFNEMSDFLLVTCEGQFLELLWTKDNLFVGIDDYYRMVDRKTGLYTIGGPMKLGAITAGASDQILTDIDRLATPLGRAFQIHDDWLDIYSESLDKDKCGDLIEGKRTLLIHRAHELANEEERAKLEEIYSRTRKEREQDETVIPFVTGLFEKYGCNQWVRNIALENAQTSRNLINGFEWLDEDGKRRMNEVVDLIILREK